MPLDQGRLRQFRVDDTDRRPNRVPLTSLRDEAVFGERSFAESRVARAFVTRERVVVVGLALVCAALAGVASGGSVWRPQPRAGVDLPLPPLEGVAAVFGVLLGGSLVWIWHGMPATSRLRRRRRARTPRDVEGLGRHVGVGVATIVIVGAVFALVLLASYGVLGRGTGATPPPLHQVTQQAPAHRPVERPGQDAVPSVGAWFAAGLGAVLVVLVPVALLYRRGTGRAATRPRSVVAQAAREAIDDLEQETDPRRAVVRAYVRMTEACAAADVPRQVDETPSEFLPRVLRTLRVSSAAITQLTRLFEEARFGGGTVGVAMQRDAIVALDRVCREIEA